jgi:hypothetical protein
MYSKWCSRLCLCITLATAVYRPCGQSVREERWFVYLLSSGRAYLDGGGGFNHEKEERWREPVGGGGLSQIECIYWGEVEGFGGRWLILSHWSYKPVDTKLKVSTMT